MGRVRDLQDKIYNIWIKLQYKLGMKKFYYSDNHDELVNILFGDILK
jgi:hypothetical protein